LKVHFFYNLTNDFIIPTNHNHININEKLISKQVIISHKS